MDDDSSSHFSGDEMSLDYFWNHYPLIFPTCGLCRFGFTEKESIIIFKKRCEPWTLRYTEPDESTFKIEDCLDAFHLECSDLVIPELLVGPQLDPDIFDATVYEPRGEELIPSRVARRHRWLRQSFAEKLVRTLRYRLPQEICENIARYCLRERAVQAVREARLENGRSQADDFDLCLGNKTTTLWAQHISFEGVEYVRSLSVSASEKMKNTKLVTVKPGARVNMYIAHDLLGIRKVVATLEDDIPVLEREPGLYWTAHYHQPAPFRFIGWFDGIKLRHLAVVEASRDFSFWTDTQWSVLPRSIDLFPSPPSCSSRKTLADGTVDAIDWNDTGVQGYSFQVLHSDIRAIIAHRSGDKFPYDMFGYSMLDEPWLYMPMDVGERISELWIRKHEKPCDEDQVLRVQTLVIRTSKSRSFVVGSIMSPGDPVPTYKAIVSMSETEPCRMFHMAHKDDLMWLGFEQVSRCGRREVTISPTLSWENRRSGGYIYTSAELEGVREVTPCRTWKHPRPHHFLGLLLTYTDGHQRCVGQVRLDYLGEPIKVSSESMWIGFCGAKELNSCEYRYHRSGVEWLGFSGPPKKKKKGLKYIEVPWRGRLDWYVGYRQCYLCHYEDSEPKDEMRQVLDHEVTTGMTYPNEVIETFTEEVGSQRIKV